MASLRKTKKELKKQGITKPILTSTQISKRRQLYAETRKQIEITNKRLRRLEKAGEYGTWASSKLFNALDSEVLKTLEKTRGGRVKSVKLKRGLTITQLRAIQKSTNRFLQAQTSTVKGIEKAVESNIKGIKQKLSSEDGKKVSKEDAILYYEMFKDSDFTDIEKKIKYDVLWDLIDEAKSKNVSQDDWINMLGRYIYKPKSDLDIFDKAKNLYEKYILD